MSARGRTWRNLVIGAVFFILAFALQCLARCVSGFGEWYAVTVYPIFVGSMGRLTGFLPVSAVEVALYGLAVCAVVTAVRHFREPLRLLSKVVLLLGVLFFLFTANCGVNYYRRPFSSYLNLEMEESSKEELYRLCESLTVRVNELREDIAGKVSIADLEHEGVRAMVDLGGEYPELSGFYPRPKPLICSRILSVQQLCGVYSPFSVEANFNREMPAYNIPHTICHELSHLRGFMREDEANFIGYLACIGSQCPEYRYSGYLTGWVYATNALARADMEAYGELRRRLTPLVRGDLRENSEFWGRFEGKAAEAATAWNDTYLKLNDQADGVASYGRMVDLMLAYERGHK